MRLVRITHVPSGIVVAEGPLGWGITPFEGNYYIGRRYLKAAFRPNFIPGFCFYKFFYTWMDLLVPGGRAPMAGWLYWLPNPLLPFIWYRVGIAGADPAFAVERLTTA